MSHWTLSSGEKGDEGPDTSLGVAVRNKRIHHEHLLSAIDFLREASEAAHMDPSIDARHIERRLVAATSMLATFQEPLKRPAYNDARRGAWEFVRLTRVLNFHSLETPGSTGAVEAEVALDLRRNRATITTKGGRFAVALHRTNELAGKGHKKALEDIEAASRFAAAHGNDWWAGLKEACRVHCDLAEAPDMLLGDLDGLTLPDLINVVEVQDTDAVARWLRPVLEKDAARSKASEAIRMTEPLDPPRRGELDEEE